MIIESKFKHNRWLKGKHWQTSYSALFRRLPALPTRRERVELPDGDFVDLDWGPKKAGPIVLLLHGLEGSSQSPYIVGMMTALKKMNWQGVALNFRSCSGEPNRLARFYHSGDTADLDFVVNRVNAGNNVPIAAIGYSLGGNVLLKYMGEQQEKTCFFAAAAVSVPYILSDAAARIDRGLSKFYQLRFLKLLNKKSMNKAKLFNEHRTLGEVNLKRLYDFDHRVTAPLHGFKSADDYYSRSSSFAYLRKICINTLLVHSADDPFMTEKVIPKATDLSPNITFELSQTGGHVGFIEGKSLFNPIYYLEYRIPEFLLEQLNSVKK